MKPKLSVMNGLWHCKYQGFLGIGVSPELAWEDLWYRYDRYLTRRIESIAL